MKLEFAEESTLGKERNDSQGAGIDQVVNLHEAGTVNEAREIIREIESGLSVMSLKCLKWEGLNC